VVSLFLMLSGLDRPFLKPFKSELEFVNPGAAAISETSLAVVDKQRNRLLIGNSRGELTSVVDMTMQGSPVDRIGSIAVSDNYIYVVGCNHYDSGVYLSNEKVVVYDSRGKLVKELYTQEYKESEYVARPEINTIIASEKGIDLCFVKDSTVSLGILDNDTGGLSIIRSYDIGEQLFQARYFPGVRTMVAMSKSMGYYLIPEDGIIQGPFSDSDAKEQFELIFKEKAPELEYRADIPLTGNFSFTFGPDSSIQYVAYVFPDTHECITLDAHTRQQHSFSSMKYSPGFQLKMLSFWLALLFIVISVIFGAVKAVQIINWHNKSMALTILGAILLTSAFYTLYSFNQVKAQYEQNVRTQARQLSYLISEDFQSVAWSGSMQEFMSEPHSAEFLDKLQATVTNLCRAHGTSYSLYARVALIDNEGFAYPVADSRDIIIPGSQPVKLDRMPMAATDSSSLSRMSVELADLLFGVDYIYNSEGEQIGFVLVGCYEDNLKESAVGSALDMFLKLTCIFIALFVSFSAFKTFAGDIRRRRSRDSKDVIRKAVDLSSILMFVFVLATYLDYVIVVYVAQNLCSDLPITRQATMVALSIAANDAGCWLGSFVYPKIRTKLSDRSISLWSCIFGLLAIFVVIFSIKISSIAVFAIAKFIYGFFVLGLLTMLVENLPLYASDEDSVTQALNSTRSANIAASVLAILTGGYLAEYLSYSSVYIISACLIGIVIIMSLIIFEKNTALSEPSREITSFAGGWKLFGTGSMLVFSICFVLPRMLAMGYCDYLFPFFGATCGLSALLISNLSVFSRTVSYLLGNSIGNTTTTFGYNKTLQMAMLVMSAALLLFLICPSTFWSIAAFFIIDIAYCFTNTSAALFVRHAALKHNCDAIQAVSNYSTAENAMYIAQSPLVSAFLSFGYNAACIALGGICGILTGVFTLFNHKTNEKE